MKDFLPKIFVITLTGDLIVPYLLAPFYPGYSHRTMVMSLLGCPASPVRNLYDIWLFMAGFGFMAGVSSLI